MAASFKLVIRDEILRGIEGSYNENTDIRKVADLMRPVIKSHFEQIDEWQLRLNQLDPSSMGYWGLLDRILFLEKAIVSYEDEVDAVLSEYLLWTRPRKKMLSFRRLEKDEVDEEICRAKMHIVVRFFRLIQPLVAVVAQCTSTTKNVCPECGEEDNSETCVCGHIQPVRLSKQLSITNKGNYQDEENFSKMLDKHDGTITLNLKQMKRICDKLDRYFKSYSKPTGELVRAMPKNRHGWKDGTSYKLLEEALHANNETCYEYITSLATYYWGYELPNISDFKEGAIYDYELTQPVFLDIIQMFPDLRKSSPNTGFRKFKHLEARGYKGSIEEFRIVQTHDIKVLHNQFWRIMCECSGIPFIPCV